MTQAEARERVQCGAALLDKKRPGWAERIDPGTLRLHDPCGCVVGQLCGGRFDLNSLGIPDTYAAGAEHGFSHLQRHPDGTPECIAEWEPLQAAWVELINDRLMPAAVWTMREPGLVTP
jgi:hypothetical protein